VLGRLEVHVDAVVALERLLHVRNLLDEGQLEDGLGVVGDGSVGVHGDRHRSHAEEAERDRPNAKTAGATMIAPARLC